jgi:hypothetical protein
MEDAGAAYYRLTADIRARYRAEFLAFLVPWLKRYKEETRFADEEVTRIVAESAVKANKAASDTWVPEWRARETHR